MTSKNWFANFLLISGTLLLCFLLISNSEQSAEVILASLGSVLLLSGIIMNAIFILADRKSSK